MYRIYTRCFPPIVYVYNNIKMISKVCIPYISHSLGYHRACYSKETNQLELDVKSACLLSTQTLKMSLLSLNAL